MEISTKCQNRNLELYLKGELDHHGARGILKQLETCIEENLPMVIILDFSGVTFMDSSGIAVVLRTWQCMKKLDGSVVIRHVAPQAKKVFDAANIRCMVTVE